MNSRARMAENVKSHCITIVTYCDHDGIELLDSREFITGRGVSIGQSRIEFSVVYVLHTPE